MARAIGPAVCGDLFEEDEEGTDLPNLAAARAEARRFYAGSRILPSPALSSPAPGYAGSPSYWACRKVFGVHGSLGIPAELAPPVPEGSMILNTIAAKLKRRSKDDSHGRDPVNLG
jgi:hypothetical protein